MWAAISSVLALCVVAVLNIAMLTALGGAPTSPAGQVLTTAFWALQAPLAAMFIAARSQRPAVERVAEDTSGVPAFALAVLYAIAIFVVIQIASVLFAGATFFKDTVIASLCGSGHQERCAQIAADQPGAASAATLIGGGLLAIVVAFVCFGFAGYRIGWRASRLGWLGALLVPPLTASLLLMENLLALLTFGAGVDASLADMNVLNLILARAPFAIGGLVPALTGWALALKVSKPARRYAYAVARASRRGNRDAGALRSEFLAVLGFSPEQHELLVRRRQADDVVDNKSP